MLDLLVTGAGLAGLTAAILAARAGLSVRVITKGLSALLWGAGTIDLLGYLPDNTRVAAPIPALDQLPAAHPLRQVDAAVLRQAVADLQAWLSAESLPYIRRGDENLWLPTAVGAERPAYLAPAAQAAGDLADPAPLLIVGFDHFNDFFPTIIAANLRSQGHAARGHIMPLSVITDRREVITAVVLAEALDDLARVDRLAEHLRAHVRRGERVLFPAMLGLTNHAAVVTKLSAALDAPVGEIPTLPPSVPGMRLQRALMHTLAQYGGRVETNMAAVSFQAANRAIEWVATETSARPLRHRARAYLLATGGILGGGFTSDPGGHAAETLFDLPLTVPQDRGAWFRAEFLDAAGHPVFQGGVQVDAAWQPVDHAGNVVYTNLWAAGNLLAHADAIRTRSHEGLALATGAAAASQIIRTLGAEPAAAASHGHASGGRT